MKKFLTIALATVVGIFISMGLLFFILILFIGIVSSSDKPLKLAENSILQIDLSGSLKEQSIDNPFDFSIPGLPMDTKIENQGLDNILLAIEKAKTNANIKGIYLNVDMLNAGMASRAEIRNALDDFKKTGKFIWAYADVYDQGDYYISSVATKIFLNPEGMVNFCGLSVNPVFYKEALDKIGVRVEVFKVGTFKSAVEPYILTKMSDASRLQTKEYIGGIWNNLLQGVSDSRKIPFQNLDSLASKNTMFQPAEELLKTKLIDSLVYKSDMKKLLAKKVGQTDVDQLRLVSVRDLLATSEAPVSGSKDKIALLYAEGEINDAGTDGIVRDKLIEEIEKIQKDKTIKAMVFRVNSPGGSAYASEQIWKAIADLKAVKPVVVSMGNYAASGGYYISCNANKIIASPNTLTGSIGIFGTFFTLDKLTSKLGLSFDVVKTNDLSDLGNMTRPMNDLERLQIQRYVEKGYNLFVKRCAQGRHMDEQKLRAIAEGRVWTGSKALELGLVDEVGTINDAIRVAAKLGKVEDYQMKYFPAKKNFLSLMLQEMETQAKMHLAASYLGETYAPFLRLKEAKIQTGILAKMNAVEIH